MGVPVFISVGRAATSEQERFALAVERFLVDEGLEPKRAEFSAVSPLTKIQEVMDGCAGTVIVAYERLYSREAVELRGGDNERPLSELRLPSVWNQIEAAMAMARGHPLLVLCEDGLRSEGLLESRYDWWVQWLTLSEEGLRTREFHGVFSDWKQRVEARAAEVGEVKGTPAMPLKVGDPTLGDILGALTPRQAWATVLALGAGLAGYTTFLLTLAG